MAEFKGFRCDGTCGDDGDGKSGGIYPDSLKNEVIVRFVGPQISGEVTMDYCPTCILIEAKKAGKLSPLKSRHKTTPSTPAPVPTSATTGGSPGA